MPYTAQKQQLYGNVGGPNPPTRQIDIPGAIDALTGGATSLIHATMLRKQVESERQQRDEQIKIARDREKREQGQQEWERTFREGEARRKFLTEGGIPAHDETSVTPGSSATIAPTAAEVTPRSQIAKAMQPRAAASLPAPASTPAAAPTPSPLTVTAPSLKSRTHVADDYDPTKGAANVRATETARVRAESAAQIQTTKDTAAAARAQSANESRERIAKISAAARGSSITRAMTGTSRHKQAVTEASFLLNGAPETGGFGGDLNAFHDWTQNDPAGQDWAAEITRANIGSPITILREAEAARIAQRDKDIDAQIKAADRKQQGRYGQSPDAAIADVKETRRVIRGGSKQPIDKAKEVLTPDASSPFPAASATKVTAPGAGRVTPPAKSTPAPTAAEDFTEDELADAHDAGKRTDAEIKAFIAAQRKKPPVKP